MKKGKKIKMLTKTAMLAVTLFLAAEGFLTGAAGEAPETELAAAVQQQAEEEQAAREAAEREAAEQAAREAAEKEAAEQAKTDEAEETAESAEIKEAPAAIAETEPAECSEITETVPEETPETAESGKMEEAETVERADAEAEAIPESPAPAAEDADEAPAMKEAAAAEPAETESATVEIMEIAEIEAFEEADESVEFEEFDEDGLTEIEDYETALGLAAFGYKYRKENDGTLVLDENGDPIAILEEGQDIPKAWLRNADGSLILDRKGNPVATQTIPADAVYVQTLRDQLDENRTIDIYVTFETEDASVGDRARFVAVLNGYDDLIYSLQWQQSDDGITWENLTAANAKELDVVTSEENMNDFWRIQVTITGIMG